jgi:hypothetical protein
MCRSLYRERLGMDEKYESRRGNSRMGICRRSWLAVYTPGNETRQDLTSLPWHPLRSSRSSRTQYPLECHPSIPAYQSNTSECSPQIKVESTSYTCRVSTPQVPIPDHFAPFSNPSASPRSAPERPRLRGSGEPHAMRNQSCPARPADATLPPTGARSRVPGSLIAPGGGEGIGGIGP